ncbi:MAG TPA: hypothetical protein VFB80_12720 [Pirellulaceae bacterium]|nr:hypothetical protein [Pirellulaceae bacterium]
MSLAIAETARWVGGTPDSSASIRQQTNHNVVRLASGEPGAIDRRLRELHDEWALERTLEANAAAAALVGLGLGAFVDRRFFLLPALAAGLLLQHAASGWCPPLTWFRRLGLRTHSEIDEERYALKALRGDFRHVAAAGESGRPEQAQAALRAVRRAWRWK